MKEAERKDVMMRQYLIASHAIFISRCDNLIVINTVIILFHIGIRRVEVCFLKIRKIRCPWLFLVVGMVNKSHVKFWGKTVGAVGKIVEQFSIMTVKRRVVCSND